MNEEKLQAMNDFLERRKEIAKENFQKKVDAALTNISSLSQQLKKAKKAFSEINYEEPETIDAE